MELSIATLRLYVGTKIVTVSVFRTRFGSALLVSTDSNTRKYAPDGTPIGFIFTLAEEEEFVIDTNYSLESVFC